MGNTKNTTVTNSLEGGSDLTLHCKSGDNDLGVQVLHPNASFEWGFVVNFWYIYNVVLLFFSIDLIYSMQIGIQADVRIRYAFGL